MLQLYYIISGHTH